MRLLQEKFVNYYRMSGKNLGIYINPTYSEILSEIRNDINFRMIRCFGTIDEIYTWSGYYMAHNQMLKTLGKSESQFNFYGDFTTDGKGKIEKVESLSTTPGYSNTYGTPEQAQKMVLSFIQVIGETGFELQEKTVFPKQLKRLYTYFIQNDLDKNEIFLDNELFTNTKKRFKDLRNEEF